MSPLGKNHHHHPFGNTTTLIVNTYVILVITESSTLRVDQVAESHLPGPTCILRRTRRALQSQGAKGCMRDSVFHETPA
eukprot:364640-Chlamydomonas_euryale.AAC.23